MGKAISKAVDVSTNLMTGGLVGFDDGKFGKGVIGGKVGDVLLGKKDPGTPDEVIDLADPTGRKFQRELISKYGEGINKDMGAMARLQTAQQESQAMQNLQDQQRKLDQAVAQRGLGRSSIGLGQALGAQKGAQEKISAIRANEPLLAEQLRQQNLNFATSGINQILGEQGQSKVLKMGREGGQRVGGLAPLIGAGLGAYYGGPQGAQAGMGIGSALTQVKI